ncbi:MAG: hypothetical protein IPN03_19255 [Holophagales bacterium]|nr:hypothetical protein [Holophagales bacterium]
MSAPSSEPPGSRDPVTFEEARERLRSRGYLDRGVEGAVLKGALAARNRTLGLLFGAAVASLFLALALATVETVAVALASSLAPRDALVLFAWLGAGALLAAGVLVLLLAALAWLRMRGRGDPSGVSTELAIVFGVLAGVGAVLAARPVLDAAGPLAALVALGAAAFAVVLAVRVARGLAFTVLAASGRAVFSRAPRPAFAVGSALAAAALAAGGWLLLRRAPPTDEPLVVRSSAARAVLVAVDGWTPEVVTDVAPLGARVRLGYRKETSDPAAFWTTVATGEPARRHGVGALELVRLDGLVAPVRLTAGTGWYLGRILPELGLAREESVTSAARRVPSLWEVAHRGGLASLVVNWWTTWPADDAGGVVLGNHLFFAARAGAKLEGEGWPPEAAARAARLAVREAAPRPGVGRLVADARGLDAFAIAAFRQEVARARPRLALLYLPGLDILGAALSEPDRTVADRVALATALGEETRTIASFLAGPDVLGGDADLVAVVVDRGRSAVTGELLLSGRLAAAAVAGEVRPVDLAPTLLAALGVPASRQTEGKVDTRLLREGAASDATVSSWGRKRPGGGPALDPEEYVENLRSLGYLR